MKVNEGQGHFLTLFFPGFVGFVLLLGLTNGPLVSFILLVFFQEVSYSHLAASKNPLVLDSAGFTVKIVECLKFPYPKFQASN